MTPDTVVERSKVQTTRQGIRKRFETARRMRIAMEVGTHSPWVSRLLKELGHEVLVANPRKTRLIYQNRLGKKKYPETALLRQVGGVGPIVALAYILTLEHPGRFRTAEVYEPLHKTGTPQQAVVAA